LLKENLYKLQQRMGYTFVNEALLKQALTHRSASNNNNERLEFLGDAILNFVVAALLYHQYPLAKEGELTRARARLVKKETLSELANEFNLGDYLNLGLGEKRSGGFRRQSILADALEAIIGAMYVDSGFAKVEICLGVWYADRLRLIQLGDLEKDPKTRLQEHLQAAQKALPKYEVISILGEPHAQIFTVKCEIEGLLSSVTGIGVSRRLAEQEAAFKMLEVIADDER
jgi:ribonuclease III